MQNTIEVLSYIYKYIYIYIFLYIYNECVHNILWHSIALFCSSSMLDTVNQVILVIFKYSKNKLDFYRCSLTSTYLYCVLKSYISFAKNCNLQLIFPHPYLLHNALLTSFSHGKLNLILWWVRSWVKYYTLYLLCFSYNK